MKKYNFIKMELPVTNLILLCVFYPRNLFLKKTLKYKYAGVTKQFYNAFNSSSSELLKVPLQRLFADSLAQYLPLCGILLKVHINLPQFLILCIEDKQISNKLFYSFWLGPFNSEISLFILHGNYLM